MQQLRAYGYQLYSMRENNQMKSVSSANSFSVVEPAPSYLLKL